VERRDITGVVSALCAVVWLALPACGGGGGSDGSDTDTDTDSDCADGFYDEATNLCWHAPTVVSAGTWQDALDACDTLDDGGVSFFFAEMGYYARCVRDGA
jgi:hypothetical protein